MEDRFLLPKEGHPGFWQRSSPVRQFPPHCRLPLLLVSILLFTLCAYDQIYRTPGSISEAWRLRSHSYLHPHGHNKDCGSRTFKKETLQLLMEFRFASLFVHRKIAKYEASDVIMDKKSGDAIVVFDNLFSIARLRRPHSSNSGFPDATATNGRLNGRSSLLEWSGDTKGDSMFEFVAYNESAGVYLVGQESVSHEDGKERAVIFDVTFNETSSIVGTRCVSQFEFSHTNKGFEGAIVVTTKQGESLLVALCEGNHCSGGKRGRDSGNGQLKVMRRVIQHGECIYEVVDTVALPAEVNFQDYSAITLWGDSTVAIASQENAAIFIGELDLDGGVKVSGGKIMDFPRNDDCEIKYCNIEGVAFIDEKTLVAVSDSMKSRGVQHYRCREKDESIHVFRL